jgi:hypothetical protein
MAWGGNRAENMKIMKFSKGQKVNFFLEGRGM